MVKFALLALAPLLAANVVELSDETFEAKTAEVDLALVKFFAPWCGHCKQMAPAWQEAADALADNDKVMIANVDCTENRDLCSKFEVRGYPTLKSFKKGAAFEEFYDRAKAGIVGYANKNTGGAPAAEAKPASVKSAPADTADHVAGKIWTIVGSNFEDIVINSDKNVFIKIYAPWCGHCKNMQPAWVELAASLADRDDVIIAELDATENDTPAAYQVRGFPTLFYAGVGSKDAPEKYQGARTVEAWTAFLDGKSGKDEL